MAGSSSSNYSYTSHVYVPSFVTMKLSGRDTYDAWKTQMLCLLKGHDMLDFIQYAASTSGLGKEWRRSDALVKGWILGSLSEQTLKHVVNSMRKKDFTAKDVWDKLTTMCGPLQRKGATDKKREGDKSEEEEDEEEIISKEDAEEIINEKDKKAIGEQKNKLHKAIRRQDFGEVERILNEKAVTMKDKITINGNTALHVAVSTTKDTEFLKNMLKLLPEEDNQQFHIRNSEGSTLLHVAANVGNTEIAKMLNEMYPDLLNTRDNEGQTPVHRAVSNMHLDTYLYLRESYYRDIEKGDHLGYFDICEVLVRAISKKDYSLARSWFKTLDHLPRDIEIVLTAIAQNFPPLINYWERIIYNFLDNPKVERIVPPAVHERFMSITTKLGARLDALMILHEISNLIRRQKGSRNHHYYKKAIFEATRQNEDAVVKSFVVRFPDAILCRNEDGLDIFQHAVINRSEKVYNLLCQLSENQHYRTIEDQYGNNLLHLAARLAPPEKLSQISGAALQIQYELQWFKDVKRLVNPENITLENCFGETPKVIFARQHKELMIEGEKWMKETSQSYTITAALIVTVMFAAGITVPGGNNQDNGKPVFTNKAAFTLFAVSVAISLFASVTSLLMFLSILTARFSEQDFLYKLPTKLIIGLATLFISTTAMLVAFGATLSLVFGQNKLTLVPIVALTCPPITSFMTLQFPLIYDLISATYGRSKFRKRISFNLIDLGI